jgi:hypothetical protein
MSYTLEGKTSELRQHVNQQVEVMGRLDSSSATSSSRDSAGDSGSSVGGPARGNLRVEVESVRMVAATCSR